MALKFRHPDRKFRNLLMLLPVLILAVGIPMVVVALYEFLTGIREEPMVPLMMVIILAYFGFRSYHAVQYVFVRDGEGE